MAKEKNSSTFSWLFKRVCFSVRGKNYNHNNKRPKEVFKTTCSVINLLECATPNPTSFVGYNFVRCHCDNLCSLVAAEK